MDQRNNTHGQQYIHRHWSQQSAGYCHQRKQLNNHHNAQQSAGYRRQGDQPNDDNRDMSR